jgi:PTH1 family peptidyl-tRNA hydrolase
MPPTAKAILIVGLGNPGDQYAATRHNIGFMVADALATAHKASFTKNTERSLVASFRLQGTEVHVMKPLTYMNLSGEAVAPFARTKGIPPSSIVAITDEYNFPTGRVHLRPGGSAGGHNGMTSLIEELGSAEFWRLRCGIGRDFGPGQLVEYVLSPFPEQEAEAVRTMIDRAVAAIGMIVAEGPDKAMQRVNRVE